MKHSIIQYGMKLKDICDSGKCERYHSKDTFVTCTCCGSTFCSACLKNTNICTICHSKVERRAITRMR